MLPTYDKRITIKEVDKEDNFDIHHWRFEMPLLITNRSFFNTQYHIEGSETGEYQFIVSGLGNEEYIKKHSKVAKSDVIGIFNLNYLGIKPLRNAYGDVVGTYV